MMPKKHDLFCYCGESWKKSLYFEIGEQKLDLSGMTAKAQVRPTENSSNLTTEINCTTYPDEGKVVLELPSSETSKITSGTYCYDVKMTDNFGNVTYYIYGNFIVKGRVTK